MITKSEAAGYLAEMAMTMAQFARAADMPVLDYLFSMAALEARDHADGERTMGTI